MAGGEVSLHLFPFLDWFENRRGRFLPSAEDLGVPPICGRLGCSLEGGGKRRICHSVNQRLLHPFHTYMVDGESSSGWDFESDCTSI